MMQCPLCKSTEDRIPIFKGSHDLFRCRECDLIFSSRIGNPDFFKFYQDNQDSFYDQPYFSEHADNVRANPDHPNYLKALKRVKARCQGERPRLLDVGCGTGLLLRVARELGFDAEGLEVSSQISEKVRQDFKIHVYNGKIENIPSLPAYDVVVLWDVLEHLPQPVEYLQKIRSLLAPEGVLLMRTINERCLLSSLSLGLYSVSGGAIKGPAQRMHEIYHVIYFTRKTLEETLRRAGYSAVDYWLGEFPAARATSSPVVRFFLRLAYLLQGLSRRTYEQVIVAAPRQP